MSRAADHTGDYAGLTQRQLNFIVSGLLMGVLLSALDQTIVATSIRTIADYFHSYSLLAWATTAYLATSTIVTPLYGKLSDLYGRKPCYLVAVSVFALGSLAGTFSTSFAELTVFRAVQGIGAGGLQALALMILGDLIAPRRRAKYQAYFMALLTGANLVGPLVGGLFASSQRILGIAGWRWVFLINVPLSLATMAVVLGLLSVDVGRRRNATVDWIGSVLITVAIAPLLTVAELGRTWGWGSPSSIGCYAVFGISTLAYVWVEKSAGENAITPLRIFANSSFAKGSIVSFIVGAVLIGVISIIPQYFQVAQGYSPTQAGLLLLPTMLGVIAGAFGSSQTISRTGRYRAQSIAGAVLTVLSLLGLHFLTGTAGFWPFMLLSLVLGLGVGAFNQPLTVVMQNVLPARDMGVSTGAVTFFRQLGSTVGLAAFVALFFAYAPTAIGSEVDAVAGQPAFQAAVAGLNSTATSPAVRAVATGLATKNTAAAANIVVNDSAVLQSLPPVVARPFRSAFADSMNLVFLTASGVTLVGLLVLLSWPAVSLRGAAGLQEMARGNAPPAGRSDNSPQPLE